MAYREINEFESQLHDWGAEIIKFWVNVDKNEQLRRFNERENTPEKRWKITDEDWRNREKWDTYEKYVDRMITLTSTDIAPWTILEGNDKKYARIKALKTIVKRLEKRLDPQPPQPLSQPQPPQPFPQPPQPFPQPPQPQQNMRIRIMIHQQPPNPQPFINEISFFIKIYKAEALLRCFILQFMTQRKMCYKKNLQGEFVLCIRI